MTPEEFKSWLRGESIADLPEWDRPAEQDDAAEHLPDDKPTLYEALQARLKANAIKMPDIELISTEYKTEDFYAGMEVPKPEPHGSDFAGIDEPKSGSGFPDFVESKDRRYMVRRDFNDAILMFGKYRGRKISELNTGGRGRDYLGWILREEFPKELKDIIRKYGGVPR